MVRGWSFVKIAYEYKSGVITIVFLEHFHELLTVACSQFFKELFFYVDVYHFLPVPEVE